MASKRLLLSAGGVAAALMLAVGANMLADRFLSSARVDLTEQHLYTLSPGTRQVLGGLRDPITLRLFYSRRLGAEVPMFGAYAERVRDMLREYVAASGGKLRLEVLDPEPFSETEDRATALGLQAVPLDQAGEQVFFGLAASNQTDDERSIPFFQPDRERFLELDLTRIVWELTNPTRPVVGLMTPLPLNGDPRAMMMRQPQLAQPQAVITQLRQSATVRDVALDAQVIDPEIQLLVLAHPQGLSDTTLYAIDQFMMRGGRLLLLQDPHSEMQAGRTPPGQQADTSSSLARLLNAWGVEAPTDNVVLDLRGAWRVRAPGNDRVQAVDYLAWFALSGDSLNRQEAATAQIDQISVGSVGEVRRREGANIEFTPLLTSSPQSALIEADKVRRDPNPTRILADFRADGQRRVLAARVRGNLATAFPDGPPALAEGQERPENFPAHRAATEAPANFVVINDTDILDDRFWVQVRDFFGQQVAQPFAGNGSFIVNLADTLTGSDALIGLRSRGESIRPFEAVEAIRRVADAQYRQTERGLQERLEATERRLRELRQGPAGTPGERNRSQVVITPEQRAEIDRAREEIASTRRQLRTVQLELRRDIDGLETRLRILNIAAVPALITLLAIGLAVVRARRRAAARA
ncbi:GldG family protein [Rhodovarius lipocyclicus]|uniref:GldG family protein n=1 Tax=Rhodovarius lipocyclicus TaxID=268410 RepID=UPI001356D258|nr:Gldg family protein [Rhodovarius lipocyclicus]